MGTADTLRPISGSKSAWRQTELPRPRLTVQCCCRCCLCCMCCTLHAAVAWNAARDKRGQNVGIDIGAATVAAAARQTIVAYFLRIPKFKSKTPHRASSDAGSDSSCSNGSSGSDAGKLDKPAAVEEVNATSCCCCDGGTVKSD